MNDKSVQFEHYSNFQRSVGGKSRNADRFSNKDYSFSADGTLQKTTKVDEVKNLKVVLPDHLIKKAVHVVRNGIIIKLK